jgi:hypothetical protein
MNTSHSGLYVEWSLISKDLEDDTVVRVELTAETDTQVQFRIRETTTDQVFTGTVDPDETTVVEYVAPAQHTLDQSSELPFELVTMPAPENIYSDGGLQTKPEERGGQTEVADELPALGVVATDSDADAIASAASRAALRGYPVYLAHQRSPDSEVDEFVERLGGEVITSEGTPTSAEVLRDRLIESARADGRPGILICPPTDRAIDFEASRESLVDSDGFAVEVTYEHSDSVGSAREDEIAVSSNLVVGIPAYNEADRIADVVRNAQDVADTVVVVDDGSDDDTATRASETGAHVIEHDRNRGYGAALNSLFSKALSLDADFLAVVDGDGQHDVGDVQRLVRRLHDEDADVVIGSRFVEGSETNIPRYRRFGVGVVNGVMNFVLGRFGREYIHDTQSGFRVYGRRAIRSLAEDPKIGAGMNASTDVLFHVDQHGYTAAEEPTTVRYDLEETSSMSPLRHGVHLLWHIGVRAAHERPLWTLGVSGLGTVLMYSVVVFLNRWPTDGD